MNNKPFSLELGLENLVQADGLQTKACCCLKDLAMPRDGVPEVTVVMLDGPSVVRFLTPQNFRTTAKYAFKIFFLFIQRALTAPFMGCLSSGQS